MSSEPFKPRIRASTWTIPPIPEFPSPHTHSSGGNNCAYYPSFTRSPVSQTSRRKAPLVPQSVRLCLVLPGCEHLSTYSTTFTNAPRGRPLIASCTETCTCTRYSTVSVMTKRFIIPVGGVRVRAYGTDLTTSTTISLNSLYCYLSY